MDAPPLLLCFILAIVLGYFAGRTVHILNRSSRD